MKLLNLLNSLLWLVNALLWATYAHVPLMAVASLAAAAGSYWLSRLED